VFMGMRALSDDPIRMVVTRDQQMQMTEAQIEQLRHEAGLDRNVAVQYISWVGGLFKGNMGKSALYQTPLATEIIHRLPVTLEISLLGWIIGTLIGILAGIRCAVKRGTWVDTLVTSLANLGISLPIFFLGIILVYAFAVWLNWLPLLGYTSPFGDLWLSIRQIIMPVICLTIFPMAVACRQTRSALLGVRKDYIPATRPKGLKHRAVILRHAFRDSLVPVVALSGVTLGAVIGWAVIVEIIFNMPGIGRLFIQAVCSQDYPFIQGTLLVAAAVVLVVGFLADVLRFFLNRQSAMSRGDLKADPAASDTTQDAEPALRVGGFARFRQAFLARLMVKVGFVIVVVFVLSAIFAPLIAPQDPNTRDEAIALQSPSWSHPLGTDSLGRDTFSALVYASRTALIVGVSVAAIVAIVGGLIGLAAGFLGGWVNVLIMRVMDAFLAIPLLLLAIAIVALLGGGVKNVIFALSVGMVPGAVRVMCGAVLPAKDNDCGLTLRSTPARDRSVHFTQVFRSYMRPLAVLFVMTVGAVILAESALSFLGAGVNPTVDWGSMVRAGWVYLISNPLLSVVPGVALMLVVFALITVSDGLRDTLDPRLRGTI
jgi:ABC-type dipeptide/oligopeptide/nickel transport system permease component